MATRQYIGVDEKARRVRKAYIGIDNVARRIKKAYIGVNGVARLYYTAEGMDRIATVELPGHRRYLSVATVGTGDDMHAIFAGGGLYDNSTFKSCFSTVYAYDKNLTRQQLSNLTVGCMQMASASAAAHAFFLGGHYSTGYSDRAYAYNSSLTLIFMDNMQYNGGYGNTRAAMAGDKLIVTGGLSKLTETYNAALTRSNGVYTANCMEWCLAVSLVPNYALFAGGNKNTTAIAIDRDITRTILDNPSGSNSSGAATFHVIYGVCYWGRNVPTDAYNCTDLSKRTLFNAAREYASLASTFYYMLIAGGTVYNESTNVTAWYNTINVLDSVFTVLDSTKLNRSKAYIASCTLGDTALFGGGKTYDFENKSGYYDVAEIEVFKYVS